MQQLDKNQYSASARPYIVLNIPCVGHDMDHSTMSASLFLIRQGRCDANTALLLDQALGIQAASGSAHAAAFLHTRNVELSVALRVLTQPGKRRPVHADAMFRPRQYGMPSLIYACS